MSAFAPLAGLPIWVAWQGEPADEPGGKPRKVPHRAVGHFGRASSTDTTGWGSRRDAEVRAAALPKPCGIGGIGLILAEIDHDSALVGVDLDTCRDPATGGIAHWAREVIERVGCYAEISPSETGLKIFCRMRIEDRDAVLDQIRALKGSGDDSHGIKWAIGRGEHPPAVELYLGRRYFAVTEKWLDSTPAELRVVNPETLRWLINTGGPAFAGNGHDGDHQPRDKSRSGAAFRIGAQRAHADATFEEFCIAVRDDPQTAVWYTEKGNAHGGRELRRIWEKVAPPAGPPWVISLGAPYDTAKLLLRAHFTAKGLSILHRHRGGFYLWNGAAYPEIAEAEIRARAYGFLDQCVVRVKDGETWRQAPVRPNTNMVNNLIDALRAAALLPEVIAAPAWLDGTVDLDPVDIIACGNGLLHLPSLELLPHTPAFFTHNSLDFAFDRGAPAPAAWLAFLRQLWPDDTESIEALQEIFGYALVADTSQQKMFLMVGPKRSGKGTIARVLTQLVGIDNAAAPTLAGLGNNFGIAPLIGKRVAIISDARLGGRADQSAIAERLLSITGEDALTVDRKYREAWTGRLGVRFLILTNELPRLNDASGALASRFIVLVLTESFFGREDLGLTNKLLSELPGILNWAIEGWRRLRERRHFVQPASASEVIEELENLGSPIGAFLRDCCEVGPGRSASVDALFYAWQSWCEDQGRDHPGNKQSFGRDLRAAVPGIKTTQPRGTGGRVRHYGGIGLKEGVVSEVPFYNDVPF